jgi:putative intracellular protease/amidase
MKMSWRRLFSGWLVAGALFVFAAGVAVSEERQVLLILRELDQEPQMAERFIHAPDVALRIWSTLEDAGFTVVTASPTGRRVFIDREGDVVPVDLAATDVDIRDYVGFVLPCVAGIGWLVDHQTVPYVWVDDEVELLQRIVAAGLPLGAQHDGIIALAQAGVLVDRRFSYYLDPVGARFAFQRDARFAGGEYGGKGLVQDGTIITSSDCGPSGIAPWTDEHDVGIDHFINAVVAEFSR